MSLVVAGSGVQGAGCGAYLVLVAAWQSPAFPLPGFSGGEELVTGQNWRVGHEPARVRGGGGAAGRWAGGGGGLCVQEEVQ